MKTTDTRRAQLKKWFENRAIPSKEKSYISQLMNGTASFGERAARRLEADYGMGAMFLDGGFEQVDMMVQTKEPDGFVMFEVKQAARADQMELMWIDPVGRKLFTLFYGTDDEGRAAILRTAEAMPRVVKPTMIINKK